MDKSVGIPNFGLYAGL